MDKKTKSFSYRVARSAGRFALVVCICVPVLSGCSSQMSSVSLEMANPQALVDVPPTKAVAFLDEIQERYSSQHKAGEACAFTQDGFVDRGGLKTSLYENTWYSVKHGTGGLQKTGAAYNIWLWNKSDESLPGLSICVLITPQLQEAQEMVVALRSLGATPGERRTGLESAEPYRAVASVIGDQLRRNATGDQLLRNGGYEANMEQP